MKAIFSTIGNALRHNTQAQALLLAAIIFAAFAFALLTAVSDENRTQMVEKSQSESASKDQLVTLSESEADISPLPNYKGDFVSLGYDGTWQKGAKGRVFAKAVVVKKDAPVNAKAPAPDCSRSTLSYYAQRAPDAFKYKKRGLLYGVKTHTPATRIKDIPGYNSCALVVYAILKKAGCKWAKYTANAKAVYDQAYAAGWQPAGVQEGGCLVAWNSSFEGKRARIGQGKHYNPAKIGGVLFRHLGITTGSWFAVDNTSYRSRPEPFITIRPIRYESPLFLCPPIKKKPDKKDDEPQAQKPAGEAKPVKK